MNYPISEYDESAVGIIDKLRKYVEERLRRLNKPNVRNACDRRDELHMVWMAIHDAAHKQGLEEAWFGDDDYEYSDEERRAMKEDDDYDRYKEEQYVKTEERN